MRGFLTAVSRGSFRYCAGYLAQIIGDIEKHVLYCRVHFLFYDRPALKKLKGEVIIYRTKYMGKLPTRIAVHSSAILNMEHRSRMYF